MRFVLNGLPMELNRDVVLARLRGLQPEPVREHGVRIGDVVYPVKQAFERASGISRAEFTSHTALRHLRSLGFDIVGQGPRPPVPPQRPSGTDCGSWLAVGGRGAVGVRCTAVPDRLVSHLDGGHRNEGSRRRRPRS